MASLQDNQEINLHVDGQVFKAIKNVLCEHSDYFSAMFSGNYVENEKKDITIDVVDANSMDIILRYMNIGIIDLGEFSLKTVETLALAANFLQITELNKQIEYWLDLQLSTSNWVEVMNIAKKAAYIKLEQLAGSYGLLSFKNMDPWHIPNIQTLVWYLSHPYLDTETEFDVFKFGYHWVFRPETDIADYILLIFGCLDVKKLTAQDLKEIRELLQVCGSSLGYQVIGCFEELLYKKLSICLPALIMHQKKLRAEFTESVYNEVYNLVEHSNERKLQYTAIVPTWSVKAGKLDYMPHYLHKFEEKEGFERWLEIADKTLWGWNLAVWGANKLVQVCGEHGRGTGRFMRDVKVYDTLRDEWIHHGVKLLSRRHAGVVVSGDSLFIVGGVGTFRVIEDSTIIYNLRMRSFREAAKFPEAVQSPAICLHWGSIYAAGQKNIYKFDERGNHHTWISVMTTDIRPNIMISFQNHIFCSQNYFGNLFRFKPEPGQKMELAAHFSAPPVGLSKVGNCLLIFTRSLCGHTEELIVEKYTESCPIVIWADLATKITVNDVAGTCALVMTMPKINNMPSNYHQKYIAQYTDATTNEK